MESLFQMLNNNDFWKTPIHRKPIDSKDAEDFINNMAQDLLLNNKIEILNIISKIVNREIYKISQYNILKRLLIKNQIYSNMVDNIINMIFNIAKEYYDELVEPEIKSTQSKPELFDDENTLICFDISI
jgi:hypothetical protein